MRIYVNLAHVELCVMFAVAVGPEASDSSSVFVLVSPFNFGLPWIFLLRECLEALPAVIHLH